MKRTFHIVTCALCVAVGPACGDGGQTLEPTCAGGDSFAGVELPGIWHFEVAFDPTSSSAVAMRVDASGEGYTARLFNTTTTEVSFDARGLGIRLTLQREGQPSRDISMQVCERDASGTVHGSYELCFDGGECYQATLQGRKLERLSEPDASGIVALSEYNGPADGSWPSAITANVRVQGGLAYLARFEDGLRIVDVSDPAQPFARGHAPVFWPPAEYYNDVKIVTGPDSRVYALMASNTRGAVVVDVTDPDAPVEVTSFPDPALAPEDVPSVHTLFVEGTRAYLAYTYDDSLQIYDIADPSRPQALGAWTHPRLGTEGGYLHDLYVESGRAYLNYWNLGMAIVDTLADPQNPTLVGEYRDYGERTSHSSWVTRVGERVVAVHGDEQYGAHVRIIDVDDASVAFLDTLGSYQTRPEVSVHNVMAFGARAYVTYYQDGLRILDLQDPSSPREIAHFNTWPGPDSDYGRSFYEGAIGIDFDPVTGLMYLVDTHRGLFVLALE